MRSASVRKKETQPDTTQQQIVEVDNASGMRCPAHFCPEGVCSGNGFELTGMSQGEQGLCISPIATQESAACCFFHLLQARLVAIHRSKRRRRKGYLWQTGSYCFQGIRDHQAEGRQLTSGHCQEPFLFPDHVITTFFGWIRLACADHGPYTAEGGDHIIQCEL